MEACYLFVVWAGDKLAGGIAWALLAADQYHQVVGIAEYTVVGLQEGAAHRDTVRDLEMEGTKMGWRLASWQNQ